MDAKQIREMFGMNKMPRISLSLRDVPLKAQEMAGRMSISGVQPKLSLKPDKSLEELVIAGEGGEFILKPQLQQFPNIPENENCCMDIAQDLGIEVPPHCLLPLTDGTLAYIVKRFDRRDTEEISAVPGLDGQLFFERVVLNFLIGNGDAHFKNYSVLYHEDNGIRLSPAYDIVCSALVIPNEGDSALTLNGKKNNLVRGDFDALADALETPQKIRYEKFEGKADGIRRLAEDSKLPGDFKKRFLEIVASRYVRLKLKL